eukprot:205572-Prorocentrum_minimum.AAC.2
MRDTAANSLKQSYLHTIVTTVCLINSPKVMPVDSIGAVLMTAVLHIRTLQAVFYSEMGSVPESLATRAQGG